MPYVAKKNPFPALSAGGGSLYLEMQAARRGQNGSDGMKDNKSPHVVTIFAFKMMVPIVNISIEVHKKTVWANE